VVDPDVVGRTLDTDAIHLSDRHMMEHQVSDNDVACPAYHDPNSVDFRTDALTLLLSNIDH
jgi:hypothetical protein